MDERDRLRQEFPVVIEVPVAWGEMDSMGHVNNIIYFRYFETARMAYAERVGYLAELEASGVGPILARTECSFKKPLTYPDVVSVGARVTRVGEDELVMEYRVVSQKLGKTAAEGTGLIVSYDYRAKRRAPIPDGIRRAMAALEGEK